MPETRRTMRDPAISRRSCSREGKVQPGFPFATLQARKDTPGRTARNEFFLMFSAAKPVTPEGVVPRLYRRLLPTPYPLTLVYLKP